MQGQSVNALYIILYGRGESPSIQAICTLEGLIGFAGKLMNLLVVEDVSCLADQVPLNFASHICEPSN